MSTSLEERVIDLETRITFLEATLDTLNTIVTQQQGQLDELTLRFRELMEQAKRSALEKDTEKPPHY